MISDKVFMDGIDRGFLDRFAGLYPRRRISMLGFFAPDIPEAKHWLHHEPVDLDASLPKVYLASERHRHVLGEGSTAVGS